MAMPLQKTEDGIIVKTDGGKKFTLKFAILSPEDLEFLKTWKRPEFNHQIREYGQPAPNAPTQAENCMLEIYLAKTETNPEGVEVESQQKRAAFGAQSEREIEQAINMFSGIIRHKEKFLQKNSVMGKTYNLPLTQFSQKFPDGLSWSIAVNDGSLTLYGSRQIRGIREDVEITENEAPYFLDYLTDIDADRMIKAYLRIKSRN